MYLLVFSKAPSQEVPIPLRPVRCHSLKVTYLPQRIGPFRNPKLVASRLSEPRVTQFTSKNRQGEKYFFQTEHSALGSLNLINSTVCSQSNESVLDLLQFPLARGSKNLGSILEKLLDKTASIEYDLSRTVTVRPLPISQVRDAIDVAARFKEKFVAQRRFLVLEMTPALEAQVMSLRVELSGVDWCQIFGYRSEKTSASTKNSDAEKFIIPPSPGDILFESCLLEICGKYEHNVGNLMEFKCTIRVGKTILKEMKVVRKGFY